jgi:YidC/Oxa1 family membrane protein insertase
MQFLYEAVTNENIILTVILSTLVIRGISVFADIKSRKSSLKMQAVQPQLDKIRKKYENDPQRLSVEQRKVMKENNVSMFGGCLPMLITMPLFFIFIAAFRQWGNEMMVRLILTLEENQAEGIKLFENFKFLWINNVWMADNGFKPVVQPITEFLVNANKLPQMLYFKDNPAALQKFVDLGLFVDIGGGQYAIATITEELTMRYNTLLQPCIDLYAGYNNGWFVMPLLAGVTTFLSSWVMMRKQPKNEAAGNTNKIMQWMMPILSVWFCITSNACFAVYWTFSNIFSLITNIIINKSLEKKTNALEVTKK